MANRVVPFILEGSTDGNSLFDLLDLTVTANVRLQELCVGGDLTLYQIHSNGLSRMNAADPFSAVRTTVMADMERFHAYAPSDIAAIVQLTDLDGAMIPDDAVRPGSGRIVYREDRIETRDVDGIRRRNHVKSGNIRRLCRPDATVTIRGRRIPYFLYYMSRNLEHVLHRDDDSLTPREKTRRALQFQRRFRRDPKAFLDFLSDEDVLHGVSDYPSSWEWPFTGLHSLERGSNLALMPGMLETLAERTDKHGKR